MIGQAWRSIACIMAQTRLFAAVESVFKKDIHENVLVVVDSLQVNYSL